MLRRVLLGTALAAFCIGYSGCYFAQLFLYDLLGQGHVPDGEFTCVTCIQYPISPFELMAGEWTVTGKLVAADGDQLPSKIVVRLVAKDENEKTVSRQALTIKVGKDGALTASKTLKLLVVPIGGYFCVYLKPKRHGINEGARLMNFSFEYPDAFDALAAAPPAESSF